MLSAVINSCLIYFSFFFSAVCSLFIMYFLYDYNNNNKIIDFRNISETHRYLFGVILINSCLLIIIPARRKKDSVTAILYNLLLFIIIITHIVWYCCVRPFCVVSVEMITGTVHEAVLYCCVIVWLNVKCGEIVALYTFSFCFQCSDMKYRCILMYRISVCKQCIVQCAAVLYAPSAFLAMSVIWQQSAGSSGEMMETLSFPVLFQFFSPLLIHCRPHVYSLHAFRILRGYRICSTKWMEIPTMAAVWQKSNFLRSIRMQPKLYICCVYFMCFCWLILTPWTGWLCDIETLPASVAFSSYAWLLVNKDTCDPRR